MKKILMVLDHEFPSDIRVKKEIKTLQERGFEVHLACFTKIGRILTEELNGIHIHRKPISELLHKTHVGCLKFPIYFNFWRHFLNQLFEKHSFNFIHIHDLPLAKVGYEFGKKYAIPFYLDLHENWPDYVREARHTNTLLGRLLSSNT